MLNGFRKNIKPYSGKKRVRSPLNFFETNERNLKLYNHNFS